MKYLSLAVGLALLVPHFATAETLYGSFRFDDRSPASLFLTGEIRSGDSFELRKALAASTEMLLNAIRREGREIKTARGRSQAKHR